MMHVSACCSFELVNQQHSNFLEKDMSKDISVHLKVHKSRCPRKVWLFQKAACFQELNTKKLQKTAKKCFKSKASVKNSILLEFREACQRKNHKGTMLPITVAYIICFTVVIEWVREKDDFWPKMELSGWENFLHYDDWSLVHLTQREIEVIKPQVNKVCWGVGSVKQKVNGLRWHWWLRCLTPRFPFPLKCMKNFLMTLGKRSHSPLSLLGAMAYQSCLRK